LITNKVNWIDEQIANVTGDKLFTGGVYYFDKIPTDIQPVNVALIGLGAIIIAVAFSVIPAIKASWIQPVRALRFE
jgi:lipoprotein-releasing system permease protein